MKHISKDAYSNNTSAYVLALSQEAKKKKASGIDVTDVTIGMLFDDDGTLSSPKVIDEAYKNIKKSSRGYPAITGGDEFNKNNINWLFKDLADSLMNKYHVASLATMGGTGALYLSFRNYIDKDEEVLLPDVGWGNYASIAHNLNRKHDYYPLLKNGHLDVDGIKNKINEAITKYKKVVIVINDPAENPSGYSIKEDEWVSLINFFNEVSDKYPLTLILDAAYMDYAKDGRLFFKLINKTEMKFLALIAMSYAKTFTMYGARLGALVAISKDKEEINDFMLASTSVTRAVWSCPNMTAIDVFNNVMGDTNKRNTLVSYFKEKTQMLNDRYNNALKYFSTFINGELLPYTEGFFLTYKVNHAKALADSLKEKNIYVLPMQDKYIRIAICSYVKKY